MPTPMKYRDVVRKLLKAGFVLKSNSGGHERWACPCGQHLAIVPRHEMSAGVVGKTIKSITCLNEGWLQ